MPRLEAETLIAGALAKRVEYTPYANNLRGGPVVYRAKHCVLRVIYQPGAPAALLSTPEGKTMHRQPRDESVIAFQLEALMP
jgi:hypothetical protein